MKKTLNSTHIILRLLFITLGIVLAIVMNKCTMRDGSTMDEAFMGLLAAGAAIAGIAIFLIASDVDISTHPITPLIVPLPIYVVTIFFGLLYNWLNDCQIYNAVIIIAVIETAIGIALLFMKPKQNGEKKEDDKNAPDGHTTISVGKKPLS